MTHDAPSHDDSPPSRMWPQWCYPHPTAGMPRYRHLLQFERERGLLHYVNKGPVWTVMDTRTNKPAQRYWLLHRDAHARPVLMGLNLQLVQTLTTDDYFIGDMPRVTARVLVQVPTITWHPTRQTAHSYDDQPAVIFPDGTRHWYDNGHLHRENGPAVTYANGWYEQNGKLHKPVDPGII